MMKMLLICNTILMLLICNISLAKCWVVQKDGAPSEVAIIKTEGFYPKNVIQECPRDDSNKIIRHEEDISLQPIPINVDEIVDCVDAADCATKTMECSGTIRWDQKSNWPEVPGSDWFAWCEIMRWQYSATGRQARLDSEAASRQEETNRKGRKNNRLTQFKNLTDNLCADLQSLNNWQKLACANAKGLLILYGRDAE